MPEKTKVITAHLPLPMAKKIDAMAKQMERPRGWIVKQALSQWLDYEEWKNQETWKALEQVKAGEVVSHEAVKAWVDSL